MSTQSKKVRVLVITVTVSLLALAATIYIGACSWSVKAEKVDASAQPAQLR